MGMDLRCQVNSHAHRTEEMDVERLLVRRGQPFSLALQCSTPLPPKHKLAMILHLGEQLNAKDHKLESAIEWTLLHSGRRSQL